MEIELHNDNEFNLYNERSDILSTHEFLQDFPHEGKSRHRQEDSIPFSFFYPVAALKEDLSRLHILLLDSSIRPGQKRNRVYHLMVIEMETQIEAACRTLGDDCSGTGILDILYLPGADLSG